MVSSVGFKGKGIYIKILLTTSFKWPLSSSCSDWRVEYWARCDFIFDFLQRRIQDYLEKLYKCFLPHLNYSSPIIRFRFGFSVQVFFISHISQKFTQRRKKSCTDDVLTNIDSTKRRTTIRKKTCSKRHVELKLYTYRDTIIKDVHFFLVFKT